MAKYIAQVEVVSHHFKLTRCYILQTKIVHALFKRVETFFITIVKVISLVTQELGTLFIYIYIYIFKCLPFSVDWLYPSQKQTKIRKNKPTKPNRKTEREKKKNTTHRGREGTANPPHKPDPKEHPQKTPPRNIWSLFTNSKRKGTYKSRESNGWKWQSFTDRQQRNHFINMPFSHLLLRKDALPRFGAPPRNAYNVFCFRQRWKTPTTKDIQLSQNKACVFGVSSTDLKTSLLFFFPLGMSNYPLQ